MKEQDVVHSLWVNANRDGDNGCCSWWVVEEGDFNKSEKMISKQIFLVIKSCALVF